jgi:hypothetical protein
VNGVSLSSVLSVAAAVLAIVVGAIVLVVGVALASGARLMRTAQPRLAALACPRCGVTVGSDGAATAKAAHDEAVRKLSERAGFAMLRLRIDPHWRFACPACGVALKFDPSESRSPLTIE